MFKQDKQKAKEALDREAQKGQGFGPRTPLWEPKDGDNRIRVMPPWTDKGPNKLQCWREVYQHWITTAEGKRRTFLCPVKTPDASVVLEGPQTCPLCSYQEQMRKSIDALDQEKAGDLRAKQRFFSSIVDMADPVYTDEDFKEWKSNEYNKDKECPFDIGETKVQMWAYGPMIFTPLLSLVSTDDANILDFSEGYNIIVTKSGKGKNNTEYRVRPEFKQSRFAFLSKKPDAEWLPDLDKAGLIQFAEAKELQNAVDEMRMAAGDGQAGLGAGQPAPGLPPRDSASSQQRGTQQQQAPKPLPQKPADEEKPPCFGDKGVHSDSDAECIGGKKEDSETGKLATYDPCPFFAECKKTIFGEPAAPPPRRGRRPASTDNGAPSSVADLEGEMRKQLGGK